MKKQSSLALLGITVALSASLQLLSMETPKGYAYRFITVKNKLESGNIHVSFTRPDPGFRGPHVLVKDSARLSPGTGEMIMVVKNRDGSADITLTTHSEVEKVTLCERIPANVDCISIGNTN
jgi:hypothetical protein